VDRVFSISFSRKDSLEIRCSYEGMHWFSNFTILFSLKVSFYVSTAESGSGDSSLICPIGRMKDSLLVPVLRESFKGSKECTILMVN
jgi:hypothetical protein